MKPPFIQCRRYWSPCDPHTILRSASNGVTIDWNEHSKYVVQLRRPAEFRGLQPPLNKGCKPTQRLQQHRNVHCLLGLTPAASSVHGHLGSLHQLKHALLLKRRCPLYELTLAPFLDSVMAVTSQVEPLAQVASTICCFCELLPTVNWQSIRHFEHDIDKMPKQPVCGQCFYCCLLQASLFCRIGYGTSYEHAFCTQHEGRRNAEKR